MCGHSGFRPLVTQHYHYPYPYHYHYHYSHHFPLPSPSFPSPPVNTLKPVDTLPQRGPRRGSKGHGLMRRINHWRVRRAVRRARYRIDKRSYHGVFAPGFIALIRGTRFWDSTGAYYSGRGSLIRTAKPALMLAAALFLLWVLAVSVRGLDMFQ